MTHDNFQAPPSSIYNLALWTWIAVALTPLGWFSGVLAVAYSHLGDVTDVGMMATGAVLFVEAPAIAVVLAALCGTCRASVREDRRGGVRVAAPGRACLPYLGVLVDRPARNGGGRGACIRLLIAPSSYVTQAREDQRPAGPPVFSALRLPPPRHLLADHLMDIAAASRP